MTPKEFVIWLRGFSQAANEYNVTPKQWQDIKDKLDEIELTEECNFEDEESYELGVVHSSDWDVNVTSGSFDLNYYSHT